MRTSTLGLGTNSRIVIHSPGTKRRTTPRTPGTCYLNLTMILRQAAKIRRLTSCVDSLSLSWASIWTRLTLTSTGLRQLTSALTPASTASAQCPTFSLLLRKLILSMSPTTIARRRMELLILLAGTKSITHPSVVSGTTTPRLSSKPIPKLLGES